MFRFAILFLLAAVGFAAGEETTPKPDGAYFLPTYKYEPRILTIEGRRFTLEFFGRLPGSVSGRVGGGDKSVSLTYFNGERTVSAHATAAIIGDELWLGVFRPEPRSENRRWVMTANELGLLGYAGSFFPEGHIMWDWDAQTWTHTPLPFVQSNSKTVKDVRLLQSPTEKMNPYLAPIFETETFATLLPVFSNQLHQKQIGESATCTRLGVFADSDWKLTDTLEKLQVKSETEAFNQLIKTWPGETSFTRGYYQRIGDVIITPWSINLGPVGLLPADTPAEKLKGQWVTDKSKPLAFEYEPKRNDLFRGMLFGKPDYAKLLGTLQYVEGEGPIHQRGIFHNCMMGHADYAGYIFWFATADDRIVRFIYPSNHGPAGEDLVHKLQIFRRKK